MKYRILFLLMLFCAQTMQAQERVVVYQEGFGSGPSSMDIVDYEGWDNQGDVLYGGSGKVGQSKDHACNLPGSSGLGYVYFSSITIKDMIVKDVDISGYHDLEFSYNMKKEQVYSGTLRVEMWVDGIRVRDYRPSLQKTNEWFALDPKSLPEGKRLTLRMTNIEEDLSIYLDDLTITGVPDIPLAPEKPCFEPEPGLYTEPVRVTMTADSDAQIYYTLDGSVPTIESDCYQAPVVLETSATVTAMAVSENGKSDTACARYDIINVPTVSDVAVFKEAVEPVRLDLMRAEVVDVDAEGIYVQTAQGGLLLPAGTVQAGVGDGVSGFLIGTPKRIYGVTGVDQGIYRALVVTPGTTKPVPISAVLPEVVALPEHYAACLVQLDKVVYHAEKGGLVPADGNTDICLRMKTGPFAQNEDWIWPLEMTVSGVVKGDEEGMYLWVSDATQIQATGQQVEAEPLGTALVTEEHEGNYCAVKTVLSNGALGYAPVSVLRGRAVATDDEADKLLWDIDEKKGYLKTPDGRYLQANNKTTTLKLSETYDAAQDRVWKKDPEAGYWMKDQNGNNRALMLYLDRIKLYALSNIGNTAYSKVPAVDIPLYLGYVRTMTPGRWGTLCVPYSVSAEDMSGALFFEIRGRINDENGKAVSLVLSDPVARLEAGVPYVLYAESPELTLIYSGEAVAGAMSKNGLQGSFSGVNVDKDPANTVLEGMYVFSGNILRKCAAGSSVGENKAYVDLEKVPLLEEIPAGSLRIQVLQEETSVNLPRVSFHAESLVYSVDGFCWGTWQECQDILPKGCYMVNGIKFIVK